MPVPPGHAIEPRGPAYSLGSSRAAYRGRATKTPRVPSLASMDGAVAAWWRWFGPPVRDAIIVVVVTAILVFGSYGEGTPSSPSDRIQFQGHAAPHPGAALILVAIAGLALPGGAGAPVAVLVRLGRRGERLLAARAGSTAPS